VVEALTSGMLRQAQLSFGCKAEPAVKRNRNITLPYSVVSRVELDCDGEVKLVYVKRMKPGDVSRRRLLVEHQILEQLSAHFRGHQIFGVARPIGVFPEELTIVTEAAPGTSLNNLIARSARLCMLDGQQARLAEYCAAAGAWLREFQSLTCRGVGDFDIEGLIDYCDIRLDALAADGCAELDSTFKERFRNHLRRTHENAKALPTLVVGRHNDFSPHHIFVGKRRISVIDFGFFDHGSHLYDVCRFWFQLERLKSSPLCRTRVVDRLQDSFFAGYGRSREACGPAFELVASQYFLTHLASLVGRHRHGAMRRWMDHFSYRWCLQWLNQRCPRGAE